MSLVCFGSVVCTILTSCVFSLVSHQLTFVVQVVEVAYYNMDRIRIVWSKIWQQMSQHFYKAGCHPNLRIAMFAVDSLRQLAIKFLEKEELASYQFQREFLNPFVLIIENNSLLDVHELVIRCLTQIVQVELSTLNCSNWLCVPPLTN